MTIGAGHLHLGKKKNVVSVFLVEFIRIHTVISWCAFSCGAFILGMSSLSISEYLGRFLIFFVSTFCILSFTFAINNYYDVDSDRINPKKIHFNAMAEGKISKKTGSLVNLTLVVIAFLTVALLSNPRAFVFCILFIFWMWAYSAPPLRLKGRPGVDIIWHFIAFVILVLWGSFIAGSLGVSNWLAAISLGVFSCVAQVWNHFNDYEFDRESGIVTYAVSRGLDTTIVTLKIIVILHVILLVPLIFLYSLQYVLTIGVFISGILLGIYVANTKRKALGSSSAYYFPIVLSFAVYINCIIYHIAVLSGQPMISILFLAG